MGVLRCFCKSERGCHDMNYKNMIIELLNKVDSEYILKRVYNLLEYLYIKEAGD